MNEEIIEYIKKEMALCDREIRKADNEIMTATEHRNCYDDRRMMLLDLLKMVEKRRQKKKTARELALARRQNKMFTVVLYHIERKMSI